MRISQQIIQTKVLGRDKILEVKGITIHWTANTEEGADAQAHRNYFATSKRSDAHFVIDDKQVIQMLPLDVQSWHAGSRRSKEANEHYISIELCVNRDGNWIKTYRRAIQLVRFLIEQKNIPDNIKRHYDHTGKDCPKMFTPTKIKGEKYNWNWELFLHHCRVGFDPTVQIVHEIEEKIIEKNLLEYSFSELFVATIAKTLKIINPKR